MRFSASSMDTLPFFNCWDNDVEEDIAARAALFFRNFVTSSSVAASSRAGCWSLGLFAVLGVALLLVLSPATPPSPLPGFSVSRSSSNCKCSNN